MAPNLSIEHESLSQLREPTDVAILDSLASLGANAFNAGIDDFTSRLATALLKVSENSTDPKEASSSFRAAKLLKENSYAFYYLASERMEKALKRAVRDLADPKQAQKQAIDSELTLVSFEEMEKDLLVTKASRSFEAAHSDLLNALGLRLGYLMKRDELPISANPFRPSLFLTIINEAWTEFDPDPETHDLILPQLTPATFTDLEPVYAAINDGLVSRDILPGLKDTFRIRKSNTAQDAVRAEENQAKNEAIQQHLRKLLSPSASANAAQANVHVGGGEADHGLPPIQGIQGLPGAPDVTSFQNQVLQATAASNQLLGYLANLQKSMFEQQLVGAANSMAANASILAQIKQNAPQGALSQVDENAIDVLGKIFDVVFADRDLPGEIKTLIGLLQVPVLKAALVDKEFFFDQAHPARRLIDLLTQSGVAWDQNKGKEDPLYQAMETNVNRVQKDYSSQLAVFSDVVSNLETAIKEDETLSTEALTGPISVALKQEKAVQATKAAKHEVAMRLGTGEVLAFVETFLENKWVPVLTLAYSLKEEKPRVLESAIRTMDDLIWSVKPKITLQERKEMVAKLPGMLATLNKWLNIVKLDDAERLQFFAELAECHASIVRAPLVLSPDRQVEIAMEVAKKAAERRREKQAAKQPEPAPDQFEDKVQMLERGTWFEFQQKDGSQKKVRLAWVSPMRSLYIFSTRDRQESFSMSAEELSACLREERANVVLAAGMVDRALAEVFADVGANDPVIETKTAA